MPYQKKNVSLIHKCLQQETVEVKILIKNLLLKKKKNCLFTTFWDMRYLECPFLSYLQFWALRTLKWIDFW